MTTPSACQKSLFRFVILFAALSATSTALATPGTLLRSGLNVLAAFAPEAAAGPIAGFATPETPSVSARIATAVVTDDAPADQSTVHGSLIALAMDLRNIRYRRGGRNPDSGFDCSGFVSYVFLHSMGLKLPATSAAQFVSGMKVARSEMRSGDLVFFRTAGKKRISHVGIYLDEGRFIHAPASGKVVRIDRLDEKYWANRFAGAKRPDGIALG